MLSLPKNADFQKQLREEIASIPSNNMNTLRKNACLPAVIKKPFRRFPTIIFTPPRILQPPLQIDQHLLPAGTVVGMQNWIHHRDLDVFPNPDRFVPQRWLNSHAAIDGALTPFSIGPRNCIGQNLAWEELYIAVEV